MAAAPTVPDYKEDVKPIIDNRCVVCHGCYEAPCQLNLASYEGLLRGASKRPVYHHSRLSAVNPTRLFVDAHSAEEWRAKGFYPVLNENAAGPRANIGDSVLYRLLALKQNESWPRNKVLPAELFDFSIDRKQVCPKITEIDRYEKKTPEWGMPFGLPALTGPEYEVITTWLLNGAPDTEPDELSDPYNKEIDKWEAFLNADNLKSRLVSRYIYEHWYIANLYFSDLPVGEYFKLVRSKSPPGQPIELIATRRPYDDPGVARVYYRFQRVNETLLIKTHMPYALNDGRMRKLQEWFFDIPYSVSELPSYEPEIATNPFLAFMQLPAKSRYRFMLDEAQFTIMGFIKSPVCRGYLALSAINEHFWVFFITPDEGGVNYNTVFLKSVAEILRLPAEKTSNADMISWLEYSYLESKYLKARSEYLNQTFNERLPPTLEFLWDGDGVNSNAALTVFRHFDSASVIKGLVGQKPQTVLVIDYPLLERMHYLLVAGFDVFGNIGHQLNTRLYMSFLRMEGEFNFLAFLPRASRKVVRNRWYRNASKRVKSYLNGSKAYYAQETGLSFKTGAHYTELLEMLKTKYDAILDTRYEISSDSVSGHIIEPLMELSSLKGRNISYLPQLSFLTIREPDMEDRHFTLINNSAYSNIASIHKQEKMRLPNEDTVTVVKGFLGAYPNAFYLVDVAELDLFIESIRNLKSESDYSSFMQKFGIRRMDPRFWEHSDHIHEANARSSQLNPGLFDYNRYENR